MKVDCRLYVKTLSSARDRLIDKCSREGALRAASSLSCYTHIPLIVVIMFLVKDENLGPTKDLTECLENLKNFYEYDQIIPFD